MEKFFLKSATIVLLCALPAHNLIAGNAEPQAQPQQWQLEWTEEFNGTSLDTTIWARCTRSTPDWQNTQCPSDDRLFEVSDGLLHLRGIVNDNPDDPAPYITGGIWTKDKKAFQPGKFEIRAKLEGCKGAWPAIWLLPYEHWKYQWPMGGEIDIMERLNNNHVAYQTVHTNYTFNLGHENNPRHGGTFPIDRDQFNVYGVEILPDQIRFSINGKTTLVYPKINDGADGQFPFYIPQYLLIDMQLGGQWVGEVDPADTPVEMLVDWVRYYRLK